MEAIEEAVSGLYSTNIPCMAQLHGGRARQGPVAGSPITNGCYCSGTVVDIFIGSCMGLDNPVLMKADVVLIVPLLAWEIPGNLGQCLGRN